MPIEKSPLLRTAKRQARALSDLSGCKLNQAQMTLSIDMYGYMSWAKLKNAIENDELSEDMACLLDRQHEQPSLLISVIKSNWLQWSENFKKIRYLENLETVKILSAILNIDELELNKIVGLD